MNATPHYHSLVLDGVYVSSNDTEQPFFLEAPSP
ncbi:MAG: hypothetical protein GY845_37090 [Planctomycetes bacterium]|nr:hypothetical protein [Planctomycetota bacterium]